MSDSPDLGAALTMGLGGGLRAFAPAVALAVQTLAPGASRVVLTMLFMGSTAGLGLWREIVALPRFWAGAIAAGARSAAAGRSNAAPSMTRGTW